MASIGSFDVAVKEADPNKEADTFDLAGETFTVADQIGIVPLGRFARAAMSGADSAEMEGLAALLDTVESLVIPEDVERLMRVATEKRVDGDVLLNIIKAVMEAKTGNPTSSPSDSSGGLSTTGDSSKGLLSFVAPSGQEWMNSPLGQRELAAHPELYADVLPINRAAVQVAQAG